MHIMLGIPRIYKYLSLLAKPSICKGAGTASIIMQNRLPQLANMIITCVFAYLWRDTSGCRRLRDRKNQLEHPKTSSLLKTKSCHYATLVGTGDTQSVVMTTRGTRNDEQVEIDQSHTSHNASFLYPTMHYSVTDMCTCVHISVTKWCIVGYLSNALWDLWEHCWIFVQCIMGFVRWVYCFSVLRLYVSHIDCTGEKNENDALMDLDKLFSTILDNIQLKFYQ